MGGVILPFPPSANLYWRIWRGRAVVSTEARKYKLAAALSATAQGMRPISGPVILRLRIYRPQKRGDLSNRIKVLEDSLEGVAYENDSQVTQLEARMWDDKENPRVEVEVEAL